MNDFFLLSARPNVSAGLLRERNEGATTMSLTAELNTAVRRNRTAWRELVHEAASTGVEPSLVALERASGGSLEPTTIVEKFREDVDLVAEYGMHRASEAHYLARLREISAAGDPAAALKEAEQAFKEAQQRLALQNAFVIGAVEPGRRANHIARTRPDLFDEAGA
jgi:hypothetical protein